jgi:hypothetical protein
LHRRINGDDDLVGRLLLELDQLLVEPLRIAGGDDAGVVVEVACRFGRDDLGGVSDARYQQDEQEPESSPSPGTPGEAG